MTKELKTLKDFEKHQHIDFIGPITNYNFDKEIGMNILKDLLIEGLRQEAIKWIKELEQEESYCLTCNNKAYNCYCKECCKGKSCGRSCDDKGHIILINSDPYEPYGTEEAIKWIKHFFNITEEDLNAQGETSGGSDLQESSNPGALCSDTKLQGG